MVDNAEQLRSMMEIYWLVMLPNILRLSAKLISFLDKGVGGWCGSEWRGPRADRRLIIGRDWRQYGLAESRSDVWRRSRPHRPGRLGTSGSRKILFFFQWENEVPWTQEEYLHPRFFSLVFLYCYLGLPSKTLPMNACPWYAWALYERRGENRVQGEKGVEESHLCNILFVIEKQSKVFLMTVWGFGWRQAHVTQ